MKTISAAVFDVRTNAATLHGKIAQTRIVDDATRELPDMEAISRNDWICYKRMNVPLQRKKASQNRHIGLRGLYYFMAFCKSGVEIVSFSFKILTIFI